MGKTSKKRKMTPGKNGDNEGGAKPLHDQRGAEFSQQKSAPGPRNLIFSLAAAVSLLTFLVYLKSLQNDFVNWDDPLYVFENPHIRSLDLTFFKWAFFDFYAANWHPLTWISHALDYAVWGLNPLGHHLTNTVLHAINTFLVVVLAARLIEVAKPLTNPDSPFTLHASRFTFHHSRFTLIAAATTGLLFGLHPVHVESVAWVAERKDLLCALFFLLSIMAYVKAQSAERRAQSDTDQRHAPCAMRSAPFFLCAALCFFILALLSKPMAVTLPVVLLILDWFPFARIKSVKTLWAAAVEKIPFIALSLISSILTLKAQKAGEAMELMEFVPLSSRVLVSAKSLILYLWKMIWPMNLIPFYPYPKNASLFSPEYISAIVLIIGITALCVFLVKKRRLFLSSWGYYVLTLLPVIGIVQVGGQSMADRYAYLPSLGPFLLIGIGTAGVLTMTPSAGKRGLTAQLIAAASVLVIVTLSFLTVKQIQIWKDSVTLWTYAIEKDPGKASVAYKNRGVFFQEKGRFDRAIEDYDKAIDLDPFYAHAYNNRGLALEKTGRLDKAFADYDKAIALKPANYSSFTNRGLAFDKAGRLDKAIADYNTAISLNPSDPSVYNYRGIVFDKMGRFDKAIADYDQAIALNPAFPEAYKNRGAAFNKLRQFDKELADYDKAIALDPSNYNVYITAGISYGKMGLFDKAIECFNKAIAVNPEDQEAYNNRGFTYVLAKQYDRALQDFNKAIALNQNNVVAYNNRGNLYLKTGKSEPAVSDFQKACALRDEHACNTLRNLRSRGRAGR
jgi:tetratricopeptide (TPR) repeat protein